jgi:hypothetical protein
MSSSSPTVPANSPDWFFWELLKQPLFFVTTQLSTDHLDLAVYLGVETCI